MWLIWEYKNRNPEISIWDATSLKLAVSKVPTRGKFVGNYLNLLSFKIDRDQNFFSPVEITRIFSQKCNGRIKSYVVKMTQFMRHINGTSAGTICISFSQSNTKVSRREKWNVDFFSRLHPKTLRKLALKNFTLASNKVSRFRHITKWNRDYGKLKILISVKKEMKMML